MAGQLHFGLHRNRRLKQRLERPQANRSVGMHHDYGGLKRLQERPQTTLGTAIKYYGGESQRFLEEYTVRKTSTAEKDFHSRKPVASNIQRNLCTQWASKFLSGKHRFLDDSDLSLRRFRTTVLTQLTSREKVLYAQLKTNYKDDLAQYQRYLKEEVKLRTELKRIVLPVKRGFLKDRLITKEWLKAFKTTIKPNDVYIIGMIKVKHRVFIGSKY